MRIEEFLENIDKVSFVEIDEYVYFSEGMELFNPANGSVKAYSSHNDFISDEIGGRLVREIVEDNSYSMLVGIGGGRGSSSSSSKQTFRFGHAGGGRGDNGKTKLPAAFNDGEKFQSEEKAVLKFREKHVSSDHEYAIAVDSQGFVHKYVEGGSTSVAITGRNGQLIVHNHPNDSAFSDTDLISVAQIKGERGIVASGKSGDYVFKKSKGFDSTGFVKAVKTAKMPGKDYNDAVDKWLTKNQSRYNYTYSFNKA